MKQSFVKPWMLLLGALIIFAAGAAIAGEFWKTATLKEEDLGLRKDSIYTEETVEPEHGEYPSAGPGSSKKHERAYENSPPLIPHDITGMLPIAIEGNLCIGCHMPEDAKRMGATPIPQSHLMKLATKEDLHGKLDNERYNCVTCHVPQVEITLPVSNTFRGGFKGEKSRSRSNLAETINEGVYAD